MVRIVVQICKLHKYTINVLKEGIESCSQEKKAGKEIL